MSYSKIYSRNSINKKIYKIFKYCKLPERNKNLDNILTTD